MKDQFIRRSQSQSGQILLMVSVASVLVSVLAMLSASHFRASISNLANFADQKRTFYVTEGMINIATSEIQNYLAKTPPSKVKDTDMTALLVNNLPGMLPAGYQMPINAGTPLVKLVSPSTSGTVLPTGPFAGMPSPLTTVDIKLQVINKSSHVSTALDNTVTLGEIYPFQFIMFSDFPYTDILPGPPMDLNGIVYANGDVCFGGEDGLRVESVRASGRVLSASDRRCQYPAGGYGVLSFATNPTFSSFTVMDTSNDNGCTACGPAGWASYDLSTWKNNVQDVANQIPTLSFPGEGDVGDNAQTGVFVTSANAWQPGSNVKNMRFTVDPPLATDGPMIQAEKFSNNADIRIVDGTWYLRDPAHPTVWPGLPIWSDHPGSYVDPAGNAVGQDDLRAAWNTNGKGLPWGAVTPQGYSYYPYNVGGKTIVPGVYGAISYGGLGDNPTPVNPPTPLIPTGWIGTTFSNTGTPYPSTTLTLNASRSGFENAHIFYESQMNGDLYDKVLPINFDVYAFQLALANKSPGELGSYFGPLGFMGHDFNGIVYVTATWPGSEAGYGGGTPPAQYPFQGAVADSHQPAAYSPYGQQALPFPLCSKNLGGKPFDFDGTSARFQVPDCAGYGGTGILAYPNALRIFNGKHLNPTTFATPPLPNGISIVTNLGYYLVGDYNVDSVVPAVTGTPWVSSLLAGDVMTLMSNSWTDANSAWAAPTAVSHRNATSTAVNTAIQTAYLRTPSSNQMHAVPELVENWGDKQLNLTGSIVVGYYPVFQQTAISHPRPDTYQPPQRTFVFDQHFSLPSNQPPGAIAYPLSAVSKWLGN